MIFENKHRIDVDPAKNSESYYEYLDRSARPEAEKIRNIIHEWVSIYPTYEHPNFLNKLRSNNDSLFLASFFELYLYVLMKKLGSKNIDIEPKIKNLNTRQIQYIFAYLNNL